MIKIEKTSVFNWENAIRGMRNAMNSWDKSDSGWTKDFSNETHDLVSVNGEYGFFIGENDRALMKKLVRAGSDHRKFMRQIFVSIDITAPLYLWKEFDTYKVATVANSTSTMHKIHANPFSLSDFSTDHMDEETLAQFDGVIAYLEKLREKYLETKNKQYWYDMIQFLPSSYNQLRTVTLNYEVLRNMYHARKEHKLDEWHTLCDLIKTLPFSELITM